MATETSGSDDRIQLNITFRRETLDRLSEAFPTALEDSERVRQAVAQALEQTEATAYTLNR